MFSRDCPEFQYIAQRVHQIWYTNTLVQFFEMSPVENCNFFLIEIRLFMSVKITNCNQNVICSYNHKVLFLTQ